MLNLELDGGPEQHLNHIYNLCNAYGPPGTYTAWFSETGGSHASWRSGAPYRKPRVTSGPADDAVVVLWFALATAGFSMLLRDDPWAVAVTKADQELGETDALAEIVRVATSSERTHETASGRPQ